MAYMFFYTITNMTKIQNVEESDIRKFNGRVNLTNEQPLLYNETNMMMMYSIKKQSINEKIPMKELSKYIKVSFIQVTEDWHDFKEKYRHLEVFGARECDLADFGSDE